MADAILTSSAQAHAATIPAPLTIVRRRLAPNAVCMFQDERPAVVNERRRGRYPRNVVSIRPRQRPPRPATPEATVEHLAQLLDALGDDERNQAGKALATLAQAPDSAKARRAVTSTLQSIAQGAQQ